jgi:hypothetical protein
MSRSANHYFTGAGASGTANYIEDVFSTFVYTGTGVNRTIDNGISLGYKSTPAQTSVSGRLRDYEGVDYFYNIGANQGTFLGATSANWQAGEWIKVDFITPVSVFTCTYRNSIPQSAGSSWAPSSIELQSSDDDTNWTTRVSYNDQTGSEAINGAVQYIHYTGGVTARYWRMLQATNTRGGSNGYNWGFGSFGMYTGSLGNGGLVWIKGRNAARNHNLIDTERGLKTLYSELSQAQDTSVTSIRAFNDTNSSSLTPSGFTLGTGNSVNFTGDTFASWTFRQQPKFFDIVTYIGNGATNRQIPHSLTSAPGFIVAKSASGVGNWWAGHRSLGFTRTINFDGTTGDSGISIWDGTPTSTTFTVQPNINADGVTYVAYLWAHDAGGFGLSGNDNVVSCGAYTGNGSATGPIINLGYEPQWLLIKETSQSGNSWSLYDSMRGLTVSGPSGHLRPNANDAEDTSSVDVRPTATGFQIISTSTRVNRSGENFIYVAIRRPMKVPTVGTSVFAPVAYTGTGTGSIQTITTNFPVDAYIQSSRQASYNEHLFGSRLTGKEKYLLTNSTGAEVSFGGGNGVNNDVGFASNIGLGISGDLNNPSSPNYSPFITWNFRRAPSFFDEVCYTGNSSNPRTITHNLTVAPEMMIFKNRTNSDDWSVYHAGMPTPTTSVVFLNLTDAVDSGTGRWNSTAPTASVFSLGGINQSANNYVAYLFATCAGVSKVGSYTGTATTLQIDCGFTGGARFVLIKRTDSTGGWFVWDTARGIVSGNDPYLLLNSTAAEVTNTDYIDTYSAGFEISSTAPSAINASGGSFIFLAIA